MKRIPKYVKTTLRVNKSIVGESLEIILERMKAGEGTDGIEDRDLVYNDNESSIVNPLTDIRSDKMELMADELIGKYEHQRRKTPAPTIEEMINEASDKDANLEE